MICKYCGESVVEPCNERMYQQCFFYLPAQTNPPAQSSSSTETQLSSQESTTGLSDSTLRKWLDDVVLSAALPYEQKCDLQNWLRTLLYSECLVFAKVGRKATLDAIMADSVQKFSSITRSGPKSPFEKVSPSPTTAKAEGVREEGIGALKECPFCLGWYYNLDRHIIKKHWLDNITDPARLTIKQPDNLFGP